ncbi:MAG: hypothetical protein V6Z81_06565 [Parvularculales bacterium]
MLQTLNEQLSALQKQHETGGLSTPTRQKMDARVSDHPQLEARIKRIENEAGVTLRDATDHILRDEGHKAEPYPDTTGIAIGAGRNLSLLGISISELRLINPKFSIAEHLEKVVVGDNRVYIDDIDTAREILNTPLSDAHIALLLLSDLNRVAGEASAIFERTWETLDAPRKECIVDVLFNLGQTRFMTFKKFIGNIKKGDYAAAANELLLSLAAEQNPVRYRRNAEVIRTGDRKYFELE